MTFDRPFTFKDLARATGACVRTVQRNEVPWGLRPYRVALNQRVILFKRGGALRQLARMGFGWQD